MLPIFCVAKTFEVAATEANAEAKVTTFVHTYDYYFQEYALSMAMHTDTDILCSMDTGMTNVRAYCMNNTAVAQTWAYYTNGTT